MFIYVQLHGNKWARVRAHSTSSSLWYFLISSFKFMITIRFFCLNFSCAAAGVVCFHVWLYHAIANWTKNVHVNALAISISIFVVCIAVAWSFIHHIIAWIARLLRLKREMLDAKEKQKPDDYAHGIEWMRSHTHTAHTSHLKDSHKPSSITYSLNSTIYIDEPYRFEIQWKRYVNKAASSFIIGQVFCRFAFGHWMLLAIY